MYFYTHIGLAYVHFCPTAQPQLNVQERQRVRMEAVGDAREAWNETYETRPVQFLVFTRETLAFQVSVAKACIRRLILTDRGGSSACMC